MLREYPDIPETIIKLNKELNDILQGKMLTYNTMKSSIITNMPHGKSVSNPTLEAVEKLIDTYESHAIKKTTMINEYIAIKENIDQAIQCLTIEEYRTIQLRYFNRHKWEKIPKIMKYSPEQCYRYHKQALDKISEHLKNMTVNDSKIVV